MTDKEDTQLDKIEESAANAEFNTGDIKPPFVEEYMRSIKAHNDLLEVIGEKQLETSQQIATLFEHSNIIQKLSNKSVQAIEDVSAIRQQLEQSNEAVVSVLPSIEKKAEKNSVKIDLLNSKSLIWLRGIFGSIVAGFILSILWNTLPLADRQDISRKAFAPLVSVAGLGSIAAYLFNQNGSDHNTNSEDTNNDDEPNQER